MGSTRYCRSCQGKMQGAATNFLYPLLTFSRKRLCFDGSPLCVNRSRNARGTPGRLSFGGKGPMSEPLYNRGGHEIGQEALKVLREFLQEPTGRSDAGRIG